MPLKITDEDKALLLVGREEFGFCRNKPSTILYAFLKYPVVTHVTYFVGTDKIMVDRSRYVTMHSVSVFHENVETELNVNSYAQAAFISNMNILLGEGWKNLLRLLAENNVYIQQAIELDVHNEDDVTFLTSKIRELGKVNA